MSAGRHRPSVRVTLDAEAFAPVYQERDWSVVVETPEPPAAGDYLLLSERRSGRNQWPAPRCRMIDSVEPAPERGKKFWRIGFRTMTEEERA